jgi:RHS repeat-associated protein
VIAYKPSDYGQFCGFTGRYHDWETGLAYFRARYFDHQLGRFIGRDPAGYVDGMGLYNGYFVPNGLDPEGLILVGIDGTNSRAYLYESKRFKSDEERADHSSVLRFVRDYSGEKKYFHGPDKTVFGNDSRSIEEAALKYIRGYLKDHPGEPLDLVGHSRGGYIVIQIASKLKKECVEVRFMGLYDAVDSAPSYGDTNGITDNVLHAAHAVSDPDVHSRTIFNREGQYAIDPSKTDYVQKDIFATHSGMGGAPGDGPMPQSHERDPRTGGRADPIPYITLEQDIAGAAQADLFIRQQAEKAGVSLNHE